MACFVDQAAASMAMSPMACFVDQAAASMATSLTACFVDQLAARVPRSSGERRLPAPFASSGSESDREVERGCAGRLGLGSARVARVARVVPWRCVVRVATLVGVVATVSPFVLNACLGTSCTKVERMGLEVTIENAPTQSQACLADVTVVDGEYEEALECRGSTRECSCWGALGRAGTYTVVARADDGRMATTEVNVREGECHVRTERVTLAL